MTRQLDDEELDYMEKIRLILTSDPIHALPKEPTLLSTHVYIGSQSNAESLRLLRKYGITHVLNCAGYKGPRPVPNMSPYQGLDIGYHEFQAEDDDTYDISIHFAEAFRFLDEVKRSGGAALVHCALGINRSGAICVAYLMVDKKISLLSAIRHIKRQRSIVLCNKGFQRQLIRFARARGLLGEVAMFDRTVRSGCDSPVTPSTPTGGAFKLPNGALSALSAKNKSHLWTQPENKSDSFGGYECDYASGYRFKEATDKVDTSRDIYRPHFSVDSPLTRRRRPLKRYPLMTSLSLQAAPSKNSLTGSPVRSFRDGSSDEEDEYQPRRRKSSVTHRYRTSYNAEPPVTFNLKVATSDEPCKVEDSVLSKYMNRYLKVFDKRN